ncbi:MAG: argonaute/piwi family protein [Pseudomonadota bacterium]
MSIQEKPYILPVHRRLKEPRLNFDPQREGATDAHPLRGLQEFGPYGKHKLAGVIDPVRIAFVGEANMIGRLRDLLNELHRRLTPRERPAYLRNYPGFRELFGIQLIEAPEQTHIVLPDPLNQRISDAERPHQVLAEALTGAISSLSAQRHAFDVVMIGLDAKWSAAFEERQDEDFDLHDYVKAIAASSGISVQFVRSDKALSYYCRCSVMWRMAIALYTKAGGEPWGLEGLQPDSAYIGVDYALRPRADKESRFAVCCAQVFDADGVGLDFVAYEANDVKVFHKNPYLRRDQMLKVMARSLAVYQRKHGGRPPKRVVVHKNTRFLDDEVEGCFDALNIVDNVELIHIQDETSWRGFAFSQANQPDNYPILRGTMLPVGPYEALLWTQGDLPEVADGAHYYKEGKGTPSPLLITRHAGYGDFEDICREILALTKIDWNNDGPYTRMPVTLSYAGMLAQIVKRMPKLEPHPYPVRLFM